MKTGLQISSFTWPGGAEAIGPTLGRICRDADDAGFDSIWVMDHFFQIRGVGRPEEPMLEGWTALGFMAAHTTRARLGLMVGGVHYRLPGLWVEGDDDARRALRRPGVAGHRRRVERGRVARPRLPVPAAGRPLRDARGDAPDRPRDVGGRARLRGGVRGPPLPGGPAAQLAAGDLAAPPADHDRGRRRERRRCASSRSTRTRPTCSAARRRSTTSTRCSASTARRSAATRTRSSGPRSSP